METKRKRQISFFAALWTTAFFLNFFWESLHGLLYRDHPAMAASGYVPMMVEMAVYDAFAVSGLYLLVSLLCRTLLWKITMHNVTVFSVAALFAAFSTEYAAQHVLHAWFYLPSMPTVFGVGLLPLFQLAVTGVAAILAASGLSDVNEPIN
ncbi:MAG: hypothetical protein K9G39_09570 [Chlorobium sp.]|uniref:hypothetical protein n=1 Tax=Chlorobium sp. TaxID=1095 RepID=UPI0025BDF891|nr:hypothetical protein [Chlorobium sp.]MCF8383816.1 hypothetical protein [Chlorobium sp.]